MTELARVRVERVGLLELVQRNGLCDRLQLGVRLVGYQREGRSGLDEFRRGLVELDCTGFAPAQALQDEILEALG